MQLTGKTRQRAKKNRFRATLAGFAVTIAWVVLSIMLFDTESRDPGTGNALALLGFLIGGMVTGILVRGGWRASFWHSVAAAISIAAVVAILMGLIVTFGVLLSVILSLFFGRESGLSVSNILVLAMVALLYPLILVFLGGMLGSTVRIFLSRRLGPLFRR